MTKQKHTVFKEKAFLSTQLLSLLTLRGGNAHVAHLLERLTVHYQINMRCFARRNKHPGPKQNRKRGLHFPKIFLVTCLCHYNVLVVLSRTILEPTSQRTEFAIPLRSNQAHFAFVVIAGCVRESYEYKRHPSEQRITLFGRFRNFYKQTEVQITSVPQSS